MSSYTDRCVQNEPIQEDKVPDNSNKTLSITIGIFFDGTRNNKYNIDYYNSLESKKQRKFKSSYRGSKTNVAKLFELYDPQENMFPIYIEGIGTAPPKDNIGAMPVSSKESDNVFSQMFGNGDFGINGKLERACNKIVQEISLKKIRSVTTIELTLDVIGFSRGAAAARSFISRIDCASGITEGRKVCLRDALKRHPRIKEKKIEISKRFLGIFDTVSTFGAGWKLYSLDDDIEDLQLTIPSDLVKAVHLVAADEYRLNFALTTIDSAKNKEEIILPGEHSDIGGGHPNLEEEKFVNNIGLISVDELLKEKWLKEENVERSHSRGRVTTIATKRTDNSYANIPLKIMGDKFLETAKPVSFMGEYLYACQVSDRLAKLRDDILVNNSSYVISNKKISAVNKNSSTFEAIKNIRADHLHISARSNPVNMPNVVIGTPKKLGGEGFMNQQRIIYNG